MRNKGTLVAGVWMLALLPAYAQVPFSGSHQEDFDSMGATGTDYPTGWSGVRYDGTSTLGEPLTLGVTTGSATGGGLYNVGAAGDPDRALGSLASSGTIPRFGAQFLNVSGETYTDLILSGVMEQWRSGSSDAVTEILGFEYSFDAADINDLGANWLTLSDFDLVEKFVGSTSAGAIDGNAAEYRTPISAELHSVEWADDSLFTIRWSDFNDTGSDGLYAIDAFRLEGISVVPEPSVNVLLGLGALAALLRRFRGRAS